MPDKDYNGFVPNDTPFLRALPRIIQNESETPVRQLVNDILEENRKARALILEHLIKDLNIETDPETLRSTDETRIITTQSVRIRRRRKEDDGEAAGVPLGGDPGGEAREG